MIPKLEDIFPQYETVRLLNETINIYPFTVGQLPGVMKHIGGMFGGLMAGNLQAVDPMELLNTGGENILQILMLVSGKDREFFNYVPNDQAAKLVAAIIKVNKDFFILKLKPALSEIANVIPELKGLMSKANPSPTLSDSSAS